MIFMRPEKFNLVGVIDRASRVTEPGRVCACVHACVRIFVSDLFHLLKVNNKSPHYPPTYLHT